LAENEKKLCGKCNSTHQNIQEWKGVFKNNTAVIDMHVIKQIL